MIITSISWNNNPYNYAVISGNASPSTRYFPLGISWFSLPNPTADVKSSDFG
jgi:hypothetical protein